ncbi:alpha-L-rhamnosidase [Kineosporia sp. NBRC 101677]|uniref:alpha-L-rhamnosidase n=1 Tax=Kineosporia sp. NBRC 101677 TaxID=3032197 RepID=UPI0024A55E53|nr:alpha-L-rhamnosidase [Kineosporia sp. NBRC 101677]GLY16547.1 alpha-L-rhamnosidase [Kineosporia sp. NBRC 101677]
MTPYALTTEQRTTPLGLDVARPRLSWKLRSEERGAAQSAYQIVAAAQAGDLDVPERRLWDSGKVESSSGLLIEWDGPELAPSTRYHWRVLVWDQAGEPATPADSWFETGLLRPEAWQAAGRAVWIGRDSVNHPPMDPPTDHDRTVATHALPPPLYLRRSFVLERQPVRARLYSTAHGIYQARLNGSRVGDSELAPGWTEYRHRLQYQTHDVTASLQVGENVLGAVVADGWWAGYVGFDPRKPAAHYGDAPAFLARLVLWFEDGSQRSVTTDGEWMEGPGPIQFSDMLMGEYVDARAQVPGWDAPGFVDVTEDDSPEASEGNPGGWGGRRSGFRAVAVVDETPGPLVAEPDEPVRVTRTVGAVSVENATEKSIVDFGQNLVGRVRLTVRGVAAGTRIRLRHAEILDQGELYVANLRRAEAIDTYVARGEAEEVFEPQFTFHGFRFAEVTGLPYELDAGDVQAQVLHSDTPWTGSFECSDSTVNQLQSNIEWGQRGNWVSVPTDCPQRDERLGWLADAQIFAATASRNADVSAFFARWVLDVLDGQDDEGAFRDIAPVMSINRQAAPVWGDGGVVIPWHLWRAYGDQRTLERAFGGMRAWVDFIHRNNPDLLWRKRTGNSYGDWLQVDAWTPRAVLSTAWFAKSTETVAEAAEVLGDPETAQKYRQLHAGIREAFIEAFVGPDGTVHGDTQTAYLLALGFSLLPEHLVAAAAGHLVADLKARGNRLTTGFVGVNLLCPVLTEHGHADVAYALLHQDEYPSWGYSIRNGATTIWERWDGWTEHAGFQSASMNSFNHYSLGSIGDWLFGRVAGIDQTPASTAYSELLLRPTPGGRLTWAKGSQETARGRVACGWSLDQAGTVTVTASVPPGSTAVLQMPTDDPSSVTEGGDPAATRPGVEALGNAHFRLAAGTYEFTARSTALRH